MKIKFVNNSIHIKNLSIYYDLFDRKGEKITLVPQKIRNYFTAIQFSVYILFFILYFMLFL